MARKPNPRGRKARKGSSRSIAAAPKRSVLAILNSPLFLWLVPGFFGALATIVSLYVVQYQKCAKESDEIKLEYSQLNGVIGSTYQNSPKQQQRISEARLQQMLLESRIDFSEWNEVLSPRSSESLTQREMNLLSAPPGTKLTGEAELIRDAARAREGQFGYFRYLVSSAAHYHRVCSPIDIFRREILVENVPVVKASMPSYFDRSEENRERMLLEFLTLDARP